MALQPKTKRLALIFGAILTALLAVVVVVISIRLQQLGTRPVTPTTPESQPEAATTPSCTVAFTVIEPTADCSQKVAYRDNEQNEGEGSYELSAVIPEGTALTPGTIFVYRLVGSFDNDTKPSVIWTDVLDQRLEYLDGPEFCEVSDSGSQTTVTCDMTEQLKDGPDFSVAFRVQIRDTATAGEFTNTAELISGETPGKSCSHVLAVVNPGTVACVAKEAYSAYEGTSGATKIAEGSAVTPGQEFVYRIYGETADSTTEEVTITDTLPAQLQFVAGTGNSPDDISYNPQTNVVSADLGIVAGAANPQLLTEFKVKVKDTASGNFTNTATVTTGEEESTCEFDLAMTPATCNNTCTTNAQCGTGLTCSSGFCRNPSCTTETSCSCSTTGFIVQKFEDANNNASRDSNEGGLSWSFQWDLNGDNAWREYQTYEDNDGKGGTQSTGLKGGDTIRVREKAGVSGWTATTPTQKSVTLTQGQTATLQFGNRPNTVSSCNNSCSTTSDCASGLVCSNGTCRNNSCTDRTNCTCPPPPASPPPPGVTYTPTPTPTPSPLPVAGAVGPTTVVVGLGAIIAILGIIGMLAF